MERHRTVVTAQNVVVNVRFSDLACCPFTHQHVIQTPAHVFLPGTTPVAPPGILDFFRMRMPPAVHKTRVEQRSHAVDFILRVTWCLVVVRSGTRQIDGGVGNVEVATSNHWFVRIQFYQVRAKRCVPLFSEWESLQAAA